MDERVVVNGERLRNSQSVHSGSTCEPTKRVAKEGRKEEKNDRETEKTKEEKTVRFEPKMQAD